MVKFRVERVSWDYPFDYKKPPIPNEPLDVKPWEETPSYAPYSRLERVPWEWKIGTDFRYEMLKKDLTSNERDRRVVFTNDWFIEVEKPEELLEIIDIVKHPIIVQKKRSRCWTDKDPDFPVLLIYDGYNE